MMKKGLIKDATIVLIISLAILLASEVVLRVVYPQDTSQFSAYTFNEDYLVALKPNMQKNFAISKDNGGGIVQWKTNSHSFRGEELEEDSQFRIIVYGDSNVQARFSHNENTYVQKLGEYLGKSGINGIEVVNAGIVGFGPDQSLIRFEREASIFKPDLVIFHIFADNDFGDILRNRLFDLDSNNNLIETTHERKIDELIASQNGDNILSSLMVVKAAKKIIDRLQGIKGKPDRNNKEALIGRLQDYADRVYAVYKDSRPREHSHFTDFYDIDIALDPDAESSMIKTRLMEAVLSRASAFSDINGVEFLVVIQPSNKDVTKNNAALDYEDLLKDPEYRRTSLTDAVENICIKKGINVVNLYDSFIENDPENLYFKSNDAHWNDQGQDIAAQKTASYIVKNNMLAM